MSPFSVYRDSPPYGTFTMDPPGRLVTWAPGYELAIDFGSVGALTPSESLAPSDSLVPAEGGGGDYEAPSQTIAWILEAEMPGRISRVA